ncbi:hypothetical protein M404DRAFT_769284 [Pisolithus tinctorius Marx 270]|uniref:Uncharacterized protein n=1 Tax=Pisolithus tinctorius Marx 270 TaxID=870435 RepID=A0A0C3JSB4_PISTI|nr:hypothetical protein M404DRAFT_769284 [Pisolithus tinctorius Marx 270]
MSRAQCDDHLISTDIGSVRNTPVFVGGTISSRGNVRTDRVDDVCIEVCSVSFLQQNMYSCIPLIRRGNSHQLEQKPTKAYAAMLQKLVNQMRSCLQTAWFRQVGCCQTAWSLLQL